MSKPTVPIQHVYPASEGRLHNMNGAADCYCEPEVQLAKKGKKTVGRVAIHQTLGKKAKQ